MSDTERVMTGASLRRHAVTSPVSFEKRGRCGIITLDRPEARNAIDGEMAESIELYIDQIESNDELWVGILTAIPPVFCAGADLKATKSGVGKSLFTRRGGFAGIAHRERSKPIIAAVDGAALAGGTEIVLACDLVVATGRSSFGLPEARRSLVASGGGLFRLPRKIPFNIAMEMALTAEAIDAERAYQLGLVNSLCSEGQAVDTAVTLAERICTNAPIAVRESRKVILDVALVDDEIAWRLSKEALRAAVASSDYLEGLNAFVEKRPPIWDNQ
jgi:enoyl-CoA hydratase